jgi:transcription initiation factor IIF auxiliary subunit
MSTEFEIFQSENYQGDDWWKWSVWVEGKDEDLDRIDYVEWTLHPTFPDPIRQSRDRGQKFRLETGGWGTFQIRARVQLKDGSNVRLSHYLRLHYPGGTQTAA